MTKKSRPSSKKSALKKINLTPLLILGILVILAIIFFRIFEENMTPKAETPQNEMKTLPHDIRKELQKSATPSATFRVPVLLYHYVEMVKDDKDTIRKSLSIHPATFADQVKTLKDAGFTFLTASDLVNILDGKTQPPAKPILLTFDDGYRDFYTDVLPIIKKNQVKVTAFIVPGFINGPNSMYQNQVVEATKSGLVEVGAHTVFHTYLKGMNERRAKYEIEESKKMLESDYHIKVPTFAYPYGAFDKQTVDLVKQAGYKIAFSTLPGVDVNQQNRFFVYRIRPGYRTGKALLDYLNQSSYKAW